MTQKLFSVPVADAACAATPAAWSLDVSRGQALIVHGQRAVLWRVTRGAFQIERPTSEGRDIVALALPGDLVGIEALLGEACAFSVTALLDGGAEPEPVIGEQALARALAQAVRQQQRQALEMTGMRSGAVPDRVRNLLRCLERRGVGNGAGLSRRELPMLRDIALIVNSTPETVCRELKRLVPAEPRRPRPVARPRWSEAPAFPAAFAVAC